MYITSAGELAIFKLSLSVFQNESQNAKPFFRKFEFYSPVHFHVIQTHFYAKHKQAAKHTCHIFFASETKNMRQLSNFLFWHDLCHLQFNANDQNDGILINCQLQNTKMVNILKFKHHFSILYFLKCKSDPSETSQ